MAAFDHRHVFIDPHPDPATFARRTAAAGQLERSAWRTTPRARLGPAAASSPARPQVRGYHPRGARCSAAGRHDE
ncbi:MAG: NAD-glutamate dehydrogenase [Actinomycetales bacterium]|nr:NAD-glutamate dehydrogenase [Actinomycetales bacterium]